MEEEQGGLTLLIIEDLIISIIIGMTKNSFGIGIITFLGFMVLCAIPVVNGIIAQIFSLFDAFIIVGLISLFTTDSPTILYILATIGFFIFLAVHWSVMQMNGQFLGYSLMILEICLISSVAWYYFKSVPYVLIALTILIICAFIPLIQYIEALLLSLTSSYFFYSCLLEPQENTFSKVNIGISIVVFVYTGILHIMSYKTFDLAGALAMKKMEKELAADYNEYKKIEQSLYSKFPDLEKVHYYFKTCVCEDELSQMSFERDWASYIEEMNNKSCVITFNQWFEEKELYKHRTYNRDFGQWFADREKKRAEQTINNEESTSSDSDSNNMFNFFAGINTQDDLKKRYRDLLKIYHPDNQAGDTTMTQQIQEAYESLLQKKGWA